MQPEEISTFSEAGYQQPKKSMKQFRTELILSNYYDGFLYYFTFCTAKTSNAQGQYKKGVLVLCYHTRQNYFSFFFKKIDEKQQLNIEKIANLRNKAFNMSVIKKQVVNEQKRFIIIYQNEKMDLITLNVKFQVQKIAVQWKKLFKFYSTTEIIEKVNCESLTSEKKEAIIGLRRNKTQVSHEETKDNFMNGSTKKIIERSNKDQQDQQVRDLSETKKRVVNQKKDQQQQTDFIDFRRQSQSESRTAEKQQNQTKIQQQQNEMQKQNKQTKRLYELSKRTIKNLQETKDSLKQQISQLQRRLLITQAQLQDLKSHLKQAQQTILSHQSKSKQLQNKYHNSIKEKEQISKLLDKSKQQISYQAKQYSIILNEVEQLVLLNIFSGEILEKQFSQKQFLKRTIQEFTRFKISQTKPIYHWDPLNKTNFHRYIDNLPNLLLIAKTVNGYIFAGFSQSSIRPNGIAEDRGVIVSLTSEQVYQCLPGNKTVTYDEYYIIFGNSQIRIKSQQNLVFSNFGISNSFYNTSGKKIEKFLGVASREVELQSYEIYQVFFQ